ncbi:MAG: hypothetical protein RL204_1575 [Bacteroidota bacterium]
MPKESLKLKSTSSLIIGLVQKQFSFLFVREAASVAFSKPFVTSRSDGIIDEVTNECREDEEYAQELPPTTNVKKKS